MLNYWWVTRPKRKLDSVPEVLTVFADLSLHQQWDAQRRTQIAYEDALEKAGLKRIGERRDHSGSGGRTYAAWLRSLGLIFNHKLNDGSEQIQLTLAGEAIINGQPPVDILKAQVLKYQFPSAFSISRGVQISNRFKIHPFIFLLKILHDSRIRYITEEEIAKVCAVDGENESKECYEKVISKILDYREKGDKILDSDFFIKYKPSKGTINPKHPFSHLTDMANTMVNWLEYTQLAKRDDNGCLIELDEAKDEIERILSGDNKLIDRPEDEEFFQRKYGLDPNHKKDLRNLNKTETVTAQMIAAMKVRASYIKLSIIKPITGITPDLIAEISQDTGINLYETENALKKYFPHGSIGSFLSSYFEMAFKGRDEATDFEIATTQLFSSVFKYKSEHLGQTGSKSAPDILLISENYQAIIDNKAYAKYSISGDHHNRMVYNYIKGIKKYSNSQLPLGFFLYISGGFTEKIDKQIAEEAKQSKVNGACISVSNFIKMIKNQIDNKINYNHAKIKEVFSLNREVKGRDI